MHVYDVCYEHLSKPDITDLLSSLKKYEEYGVVEFLHLPRLLRKRPLQIFFLYICSIS